MNLKSMKSLIIKYLANEATLEEKNAMDCWRKESASNEDFFQREEEIWIIAGRNTDWIESSKEDTWNKLSSRIPVATTNRDSKRKSRKLILFAVSTAAAIAFLIGLSIPHPFGVNNESNITTIKTPKGQRSEVILPDGTTAWLNSASSISYNGEYNTKHRDLTMKGEVCLDVAKKEKQTFNLYTSDVKIEVIGTAFTVDAREENDEIYISLIRGKIVVKSEMLDKELDIAPNQKLTINKTTKVYSLEECDAATESMWVDGQLKLVEASIHELAHKMGHWYGVNIRFDQGERNEKYWITIKTESLTEALNLMNKITPIEYNIAGEEVSIRYK